MVRVFRRLEAHGLIRGGRFVDGIWGEQYALPEAVTLLRKYRTLAPDGHLVALSAANPLNLLGVFGLGHRLSAITGNRVLSMASRLPCKRGRKCGFWWILGSGNGGSCRSGWWRGWGGEVISLQMVAP